MKLGINACGRIGKLSLWHHVSRKYFDEIILNLGRQVGGSLHDLAHYIERDSTYGSLHGFLYGHKATSVINEVDEKKSTIVIDGVKVKVLTKARNPYEIDWAGENVKLVVDSTGLFLDPTLPANDPAGSCLGHLECGAEKVIVSAPFKITDKSKPMPDYAVTTVMGINHNDYDPRKHKVISAASCTTTCLAYMFKPLLDYFGVKRILSTSMATIHAITPSQVVLDRMPEEGATDLRKTRSVMNNIILTSTGAAKTLSLVIPEMKQIGFIAESVRIPATTGSLIILVVNLQDDASGQSIRRDLINDIYKKAAAADKEGYLHYTDKQNASTDIIGQPKAAAIIEGHETHTRTGEIAINLDNIQGDRAKIIDQVGDNVLKISVTQAVIYGWYDNEFGSYVNMLGDRTVSIAESL
ncbi:MAG: glyceraldehyde-3-phosphate dehydrogenase [Deltaproteobacteria bacterium]|nr:glyceraldehyde-3-phosphate dehydrogenase [Deltaproteobacteria bacterium]MBW2051185.1 glyceraldehyde-3-phosphate dehydrogenase [Deltaproteobacteria bacterium]MBW2141922.1 glyceraldehyde-3-phosphate dehydrogenase [Deltaproteobacteria bacterium]MBW2323451.1 glyceraldehyde-3-phosphate dehydrogenase [Deltaproteobacteria bacterium]